MNRTPLLFRGCGRERWDSWRVTAWWSSGTNLAKRRPRPSLTTGRSPALLHELGHRCSSPGARVRACRLVLASFLVAGCGVGPVAGEAPDPGARACVVFSISGGIAGLADTTVLDSATATLVRTKCLSIRGAPNSCAGGTIVTRVQLTRSEVEEFFRATQTSDFRRLGAQYDMSGTFVDGPEYKYCKSIYD